MEHNFKPMRIEDAKKIKNWQYNGFVKEIYMDPYFESYKNLLDSKAKLFNVLALEF